MKVTAEFMDTRLPERFWNKVSPCPMSGCWLWTAVVNREGYGVFRMNGGARLAHRVSYEFTVGVFPVDLVADHLCRVRCCVNPSHLEPVTQDENKARGELPSRSHCINGHRFTEDNLYHPPSGVRGRRCRSCQVDRSRIVTERKRNGRNGAVK